MQTAGLHHVTAVASDPQQNVDFYTDVLGLRLVKQTVNFDDTSTYHLYYGDETGSPGTILTFFPFQHGRRGTPGRGQTTATAFTIPEPALEYWLERLEAHNVAVDSPRTRFEETVIAFEDTDGQPLELVTGESTIEPWEDGPVPTKHAIRGFHGVTLHSLNPDQTGAVLETLGYERDGTETDRVRYRTAGEQAAVVDVRTDDGNRGSPGAGTVHHIAFRTPTDETQAQLRDRLTEIGMVPTPQKDRQYFRSIYFREPGGILFEIATNEPGFAIDESVDELGTTLKVPPWLEDNKAAIAARLPELEVGDATSERTET